jgi:hypothetical protein
VGHIRNALSNDSNHQQPHQSNTNHIQPQQQLSNSGIQSLIDADSVPTIIYNVQLMNKIMTRDDIKTTTSIPPILRRLVASAKIKLLNDIKSDPSNVSKHVLLIIFTKIVLAAMPYEEYWKTRMKDRSKKQIEYTNTRIQKCDLTNIIPLSITMDQVSTQLRRFPKDSACANSGDRAQHHLDLLASGLPILPYGEALTTYLNLLSGGKAPVEIAPYVGSAHLIPLQKADESIRPIAVGEILRRLLSSFCAQSVLTKAKQHLGNSQQGIGCPNAIEIILVGLNRVIIDENIDPETTVALFDYQNAFC